MTPSIWTAIFVELPLHEALPKLSAFGWRSFEVASEHLVGIENAAEPDRLIDQAQACLAQLGVSVPQAHGLLAADVAHPDAHKREHDLLRLQTHIDIAARLGVRCVVIHPAARRGLTPVDQEETDRLNVTAFRRLGDWAGERGVRIGLENLMRPGAMTSSELLALVEAIDRPAIGLVLDTSHAHRCRLDVAALIRACGALLIGTHISDNDGSADQHLTPGNGTVDWPAVMQALTDIGYTGLFNLEIPGERHRLPAFRDLKLRHAYGITQCLLCLGNVRR